MMSLARQALREILPEDASVIARNRVHEILAGAALGPPGKAFAKPYREIGAHILPAQLVESRDPQAQRLIVDHIRFRALSADLAGAAELARAAVTTWQRPGFLGADHELVLRVQVQLASTLRGLGGYGEARAITTGVVRQLQANVDYGPDHELTLTAQAGAASDLIISGRYSRAVAANRENYERSKTALGAGHSRTVDCRRQLAFSLCHAGFFAEAVDLDQSDFDRMRSAGDNIDAVRVAFALAEDLVGLGEYGRALEMLIQYVPAGGRLLGADDTRVLAAGRTAGVAKRRLGQQEALTELEALYRRACKLLDEHHPHRLAITVSYANALREAGGTTNAEKLTLAAIDCYRTRLGDRHPLSIAARINLAAIQRAKGKWADASETGQRAIDQLRRVLGATHPYSIAAAINHATDLALTGDRTATVLASKAVYSAAMRSRGAVHPDTLAAGTNLTLDLLSAGTPNEGLREQMLTAWRNLLGENEFVAQLARGCRIECDIDPIPI